MAEILTRSLSGIFVQNAQNNALYPLTFPLSVNQRVLYRVVRQAFSLFFESDCVNTLFCLQQKMQFQCVFYSFIQNLHHIYTGALYSVL